MLRSSQNQKIMEKVKYSYREIRAAWKKWIDGKISQTEFLPYFMSCLSQDKYKLLKEFLAEHPMPKTAQRLFVKRKDADEIMHRYCIYSNCEADQIHDGNGALFLKNKHVSPEAIKEMINRFKLSEGDQMALFEVQAEKAKNLIADYVRLYNKRWGLSETARRKAIACGYIKV